MKSKTEMNAKTFLIGGVAGSIAKTVVAPLDRMKILYQTSNSHYKNMSILNVFKNIYKKEGIAGYFKGNLTQVIRIFPYSATQWLTFEHSYKLSKTIFGEKSPYARFTAGVITGLVSVSVTYPFDILRARFASQVNEKYYVSLLDSIKKISAEHNGKTTGIFIGLRSTLIGCMPYAGTSFCTFNSLKNYILEKNNKKVLDTIEKFFVGTVAGITAQTVSYPFDVVRRYEQIQDFINKDVKYNGLFDGFKKIIKNDGVSGLFRGITVNYIRIVPTIAVSFTLYETLKEKFNIEL